MLHIPDSFAVTSLQLFVTFLGGIVFCSFAEHAIHRHVMHRLRLPRWVYRIAPDLRVQFDHHAVLHHGKYYKQFDYEPCEEGKFLNLCIRWPDTLRMLVFFLPLLVIVGVFASAASMGMLVLMVIGQNMIWSRVHVQMHVPESDRWFRRTGYFRFIARHHFMHHRRAHRNYNVVLPLADFLMGAVARPCLGDVREMLRLGYLEPRTAAGRRFMEANHRPALKASVEGITAA